MRALLPWIAPSLALALALAACDDPDVDLCADAPTSAHVFLCDVERYPGRGCCIVVTEKIKTCGADDITARNAITEHYPNDLVFVKSCAEISTSNTNGSNPDEPTIIVGGGPNSSGSGDHVSQ